MGSTSSEIVDGAVREGLLVLPDVSGITDADLRDHYRLYLYGELPDDVREQGLPNEESIALLAMVSAARGCPDDQEVSARADAARNILFITHQQLLRRVVRSVCFDINDAAIVESDAFGGLIRHIEGTDLSRKGSGYSLIGAVWKIVRNAHVDLHRTRSRAKELVHDPVAMPDVVDKCQPEEEYMRHLGNAAVHRMLGYLEPRDRQIIILRVLEGMDAEAVCRALEMDSPGAVRTAQHRALRRLEQMVTRGLPVEIG